MSIIQFDNLFIPFNTSYVLLPHENYYLEKKNIDADWSKDGL